MPVPAGGFLHRLWVELLQRLHGRIQVDKTVKITVAIIVQVDEDPAIREAKRRHCPYLPVPEHPVIVEAKRGQLLMGKRHQMRKLVLVDLVLTPGLMSKQHLQGIKGSHKDIIIQWL